MNNQEETDTEDTADTEEQGGNNLADLLHGLSDEKLARMAKEWREKRSQHPGDKQIRAEYIEIQKELARRGASS